MTSPEGFVELTDAISAVRDQLAAAREAALHAEFGSDIAFAVEAVTIEFVGELRKTGGAKGGVKFWVVSAEASGELSRATTQRVTVQLRPHGSDGSGVDVGERLDAVPLN